MSQQQPERTVVLDQPEIMDDQALALQRATERAEAAEAELAKLKSHTQTQTPETTIPNDSTSEPTTGIDELRKDSMMVHLIDSLAAGKDIGHYGRLTFAMVARHFLPHAEVLHYLTLDPDFSPDQAELMLHQVEGRDYSPPRRERLLDWQAQQDFPILPHPEDPDCGNLYRTLKFPPEIYDHISHYQEEKLQSTDQA